MSSRAWFTFDVIVTFTLFSNEHCIHFFNYVQQLRRNLKKSQKTMFKTRVLKIFDCLKSLIIKIHVQSEVFNLLRVLKKINYMHRNLIEIIFFLSILKSDSASQKEELSATMKIFAKNLNVMIKHCNKNVIKCLQSRTIIQIVAKTNTIIDRMKNEFREIANVSNISSMNRILIFLHLRNENIKFFVRKKKNVMFLCQHFQWIRLYDVEIRMQLRIFEILMHSIKINIFVLHDDRNMTIVIETLNDANTTRIFELTMKEIVFMKWLKKIVLDENEQISVMLKFIFVETINAIIKRHFVWNDEIHICERFFCNCKIKQCYNCWRYDHIENQCLSISKCDQCDKSKHSKSVCQMFIIRTKCAICEKSHDARNKNCRIRQQKMKKTKSTKIDEISFFFVKQTQTSIRFVVTFCSSFFEAHFSLSNMKRKELLASQNDFQNDSQNDFQNRISFLKSTSSKSTSRSTSKSVMCFLAVIFVVVVVFAVAFVFAVALVFTQYSMIFLMISSTQLNWQTIMT